MSKTVFISDLHLREPGAPEAVLFLKFLEKNQQALSALYILGDFFDHWVGEDLANDFQQSICRRLKDVSENGCRVFFLPGNRDFLTEDVWARKHGIELLRDPCVCHLRAHSGKSQRLLLSHGDLLCHSDWTYRLYRAVVQNRFFKGLFLRLPRVFRAYLARKMRRVSRRRSLSLGMRGYFDTVLMSPSVLRRWRKEHAFDHIVHGHIHRLVQEPFRTVLTDWSHEAHYLAFDDTSGQLTVEKIEL